MRSVSVLMIVAAVVIEMPIASLAQAAKVNLEVNPQTVDPQVVDSQTDLAQALLRPSTVNPRPSSVAPPTDRPASRNSRPGSLAPSQDAGFKYRLIIQGSSDSLLQQVRRAVPDAFRTIVDGRRVIQAGLFVERSEAEAVQRQLDSLNAESSILDLNQITTQSLPPLPASSNRRTSFSYRLIVQGDSDSLLRQVRQIVPDAFRITLDGRRVIQAGLFVERSEAEAVQRQLNPFNTQTSVLDVNYGTITRSPSSNRSPNRSIPRIPDGRIVIAIDPGHGGHDPGAVGIGSIHESEIVLAIAQQVAKLLDAQGVQAVLTREDDREIDLAPRVDLAEQVNADLFVSIHANSINMSRPDVNGIETYYYSSSAAQQLAQSIHQSLVSQTGMNDRGIHQARFYVLTQTSMPSVLVEVGFVTGREDASRLSSASFRDQIAAAIVQGILRYVK